MTQTEEIRLAALAKPGSNAVELLDACKGVEDIGSAATYLKILCDKGALSRAKVDGKFHYWPPGQAPADEFPGVDIDKHSKRGIDRAEAATSGDRSAGVGHATGAALRPTSGSKTRGPQHASPNTRSPAEAMKAGGRSSASPSPGVTQSGWPTSIITPDWLVTQLRDGVLVIRKDTDQGFFLNGEAVAAIIAIGAP